MVLCLKDFKVFLWNRHRKFGSQGLRQKYYCSIGKCIYPNLLFKTIVNSRELALTGRILVFCR
jgi:hypothetical protein